jgi:hypothetical protein
MPACSLPLAGPDGPSVRLQRCLLRRPGASPDWAPPRDCQRTVAFHRAADRFRILFTRHGERIVIYWNVLTKPRRTYPMDNHSSALVARHAGLDARIADESRRPSPDAIVIASLKKQKLKIKETLSRL